jgi:hypothetical protein
MVTARSSQRVLRVHQVCMLLKVRKRPAALRAPLAEQIPTWTRGRSAPCVLVGQFLQSWTQPRGFSSRTRGMGTWPALWTRTMAPTQPNATSARRVDTSTSWTAVAWTVSLVSRAHSIRTQAPSQLKPANHVRTAHGPPLKAVPNVRIAQSALSDARLMSGASRVATRRTSATSLA